MTRHIIYSKLLFIFIGIITSNYSIYSTSAQQQDLIEERLKTIIPLLMANKDNLSKRCSTFAIPSLCLFAFPLCDRRTKQPKQICRFDCKQLQQDLCKNEYFNVRTLFESKLSDRLQNFLLDCNQLPPSSDSPQDCLPIVSMTLEKLESSVVALGKMEMGGFGGGGGGAGSGMSVGAGNAGVNVNDDLTASIKIEDKKLAQLMYFLLPASLFMFLFIVIFLTVFYCRKSSNSSQNNFNKGIQTCSLRDIRYSARFSICYAKKILNFSNFQIQRVLRLWTQRKTFEY